MTVASITYDGEVQSIDHLAPFQFECECKDKVLIIAASFTGHCYSKAFNSEIHTKEKIIFYDKPDRPRVFCPVRYELSVHLPDIVKTFPTKKVLQSTSRRNYVFFSAVEIDGLSYTLFFMLQRDRSEGAHLRLTVESAYLTNAKTEIPKMPGTIRFSVLADKICQGHQISFARR